MKDKGQKQQYDPLDELVTRERYITAEHDMDCDGCLEHNAIGKGSTYMEDVTSDGKSKMVFCARCIFAIKARQAATNKKVVIHQGDLVFEKLPHRFQGNWNLLRKRFTELVKKKNVPQNEAWHEVCNKFIDEMGMRHIYEQSILLAKYAEKFHNERAEIDRAIAKTQKVIRSVKKGLSEKVNELAKIRLAMFVSMQRDDGKLDEHKESFVQTMNAIRAEIARL